MEEYIIQVYVRNYNNLPDWMKKYNNGDKIEMTIFNVFHLYNAGFDVAIKHKDNKRVLIVTDKDY